MQANVWTGLVFTPNGRRGCCSVVAKCKQMHWGPAWRCLPAWMGPPLTHPPAMLPAALWLRSNPMTAAVAWKLGPAGRRTTVIAPPVGPARFCRSARPRQDVTGPCGQPAWRPWQPSGPRWPTPPCSPYSSATNLIGQSTQKCNQTSSLSQNWGVWMNNCIAKLHCKTAKNCKSNLQVKSASQICLYWKKHLGPR